MTDDSKLSTDNVRLRKVAKGEGRREDAMITKRRRTIAVSSGIAEAVASHSAVARGPAVNNVETQMTGKHQTTQSQSELEQAFNRLRRRASQTAQTSVSTERSRKLYAQESKSQRSKPVTSQRFTSPVSSQTDDAGFSRLGPYWKSMSSLASDESVTQKTPLIKSSQTFEHRDSHVMSNTKTGSVALAASASDSQFSTSDVKSRAQSEACHSAETEKLSTDISELTGSDKKLTKPTECTTHFIPPVTQATEISKTSSSVQSGSKPELGPLVKNSDTPVDSEIITTDMEDEQSKCVSKKKQTSLLTAGEAVASFTSCVGHKNISQVSPESGTESQQPSADRQFPRQKCLGVTEQEVNGSAAQLLRRSLDASCDGLPQGLRSCAEWKTDDGGNGLDIKLRKSHSIALKPRKDPAQTGANTGTRSVLKRTTSAVDSSPYHSPVHRDVVSHTREIKLSAESSDRPTSVISVCDKTQLAGNVAGGHVQHLHPLRADGQLCATKKRASVAVCDGVPGEPIWFALARQKTQKWTEGKV